MPKLTLHTFAGDVTQEITKEALSEMLPVLIANSAPFSVAF